MNNTIPNGIHTAIVTPFLANFQIDWDSFEKLIEAQIEARVDGVVISGTTGESPTLTPQEKLSLIKKAKTLSQGKLHVMAGTGGNNTQQSVELSKLAEQAGADSLLVVTPPYNKPSLKGLKAHFQAIGDATALPICLYHVPGRTAQKLSADDIADLCTIPTVTAVKEASADLALFSNVANKTGKAILSGDDPTFLPSLAAGGKGLVSVATNLIPKAYVKIWGDFRSGKNEEATELFLRVLAISEAMFLEPNPTPLKGILAELGLISSDTVRLPLVACENETKGRIKELYESLPAEVR